ncbi:hypothetical protein [Silvibacterium dinghuense]|nr:hypothetical protein [Silvibacterium dinghuense]
MARCDTREQGTAEKSTAALIENLALVETYTVGADGNFNGNTVQGCMF